MSDVDNQAIMPLACIWPLLVLTALTLPSPLYGQDVTIDLLFDGEPIRVTTEPEFACLDRTQGKWIACPVTRDDDSQRYRMPIPAPGEYTLHVKIDENRKNPARFPGDYDVFHPFQIDDGAPAELRINVPRLMHVTAPWDNDRDLNGMLARPWAEKPAFTIDPRSGLATVTFEWDEVVAGAEYRYRVVTARNDPYFEGAEIERSTTGRTKVTLRLPPSPPEHYYRFTVSAEKDGRLVGDFMTHDSGIQSWAYTFIVRDAATSSGARDGARGRTATGRENSRLDRSFADEWKRRVPRPAWWDDVPDTAIKIRSLGDLMAVWQSQIKDEDGRRRFYKLVYEGVVARPGDRDLAAEGVHLMAFVADGADRLTLLEFAVERFFAYDRRTDNCVNCMTGDTTGEIVRDLASVYISSGRTTEAIELIQRLVNEREADVSAYNLALTFETLSHAYWEIKDVAAAKAAVEEGLRRFPEGWQADQLRKTLERYEGAAIPDWR